MPLVCINCHTAKQKQLYFYQISRKYKGIPYRRLIKQPSNGLHVESWIKDNDNLDNTPDGVYCDNCHKSLNEQYLTFDELALLADNRMETWSFKDQSLDEVVGNLTSLGDKIGSSVERYHINSKSAQYGELEKDLPSPLANNLKKIGIEKLYSHQAEAINRIRNGENVVITTGTASGKSMVYTIPALETFLNDENATVLYLSPLKALTRDQLMTLDRFNDNETESQDSFGYRTISLGGKKVSAGVLEGGKSDSVKELTYDHARYWLTNAHFLHFILQGAVHFKHKSRYIRFFKNLKYVVIDELHAYNGILGSKVAMLLRRLRNLCKALGNIDLQFIACSASIGNPKELAEEITGLKGRNGFSLIDHDGSPAYEKEILLWNPGLLGQKSEQRTRRAPISEAIEILKSIAASYRMLPKSIFFYGNRKAATNASFELNNAIRSRVGEVLQDKEVPLELFSPFHAQLNWYKKQEIMDKIKKGELVGLVSTSALEMGIDIGDLSLCIMIGYAGSKASFLQQAGRVGRKGPGLIIQIFQEDPLEQYYAANPVEFMEREPEHVTIDVSNPLIVSEHMQYAAFEVNGKLTSPHNYFKVSAAKKADGFAEKMKEVKKGLWELTDKNVIYNNLLKGGRVYTVINQTTKEALFEGVDDRSLLRDYHYGSVFLYNQKTYKVTRILSNKNEVWTVPFKADYTTRGQVNDSINVSGEVCTQPVHDLMEIGKGKLVITRRLWGYKKVNLFGGGTSDLIEDTNMYPVKYTTDGLWIQFTSEKINESALHVLEHGIASAIPTIVKCSHSDFSLISSCNLKEFDYRPTIVFYEADGGGAGIMEAIESRLVHILNKALAILKACECKEGCPNCTHLSICERNNENLDKVGGVKLLEILISEIVFTKRD
ncbi:DEAD/DEAH box helicase [Cytobacillus sp. SAFR-174]|uniref:DEAD/DEAH box helicase n=1 Tax=Cytobacillus sp. SAFR-174 TaxID=3436868 RepID=UPI003F7D4809